MAAAAEDDTGAPPPTPGSSTSSTTSSSPVESRWKERRHRRRNRQREARAAEALSHDASDTSHHRRTSERLLRNAVRNQIKEDMLASSSAWDCAPGTTGNCGLRIAIECGFDHLMDSEAERKSLVTQLQLSYASCLGLVADAVLERWERAAAAKEGADKEASRGTSGDMHVLAGSTDEQHTHGCKERPLAKERHKAEAKRALDFAAADWHEKNQDDDETSPLALQHAPRTGIKPVSLMFTSFRGRVAEATGRDGGSKNWAVRTNELPFDRVAATSLHACPAGGGGSDSEPLRVIVLSPDAPEALAGAPDRKALYVVGGICDYKRHMNATLDCARSANDNVAGAPNSVVVEAMRLPIEETFEGSVSVNILTVNQAVEALVRADINGGDWAEALAATLPSRKLRYMHGE